jgi:PBSX family phage terminase large subunit
LNDFAAYSPLSYKQAEYIKQSEGHWLNVIEGGKRAGKNICNVIAFARCVDSHADRLFLAAGVSISSAKLNILDANGYGLQRFFRGRCRPGAYLGKHALFVRAKVEPYEKIIVFAGGGRRGDARLIKGNSYGAAYITEANECAKEFVLESIDRTLASSDRRVFLDLNPKSPNHWFYREFLDWHDKNTRGYQYCHMTIRDNMSLSDGKLTELLACYDKESLWYKSEILGMRTTASGLIFPGFDRVKVSVPYDWMVKQNFTSFSIGVDIGGTDATAATLVGFRDGYSKACLIDGYYHKQGKDTGRTHDVYAREITAAIKKWAEEFKGFADNAVCFCDSADKLFRQALINELKAQALKLRVLPTNKSSGILGRIRLTGMLINQGRLEISDHMRVWSDALESARWDAKCLEKGEWARLDDGSACIDALDSMEYAIQPFVNKLI